MPASATCEHARQAQITFSRKISGFRVEGADLGFGIRGVQVASTRTCQVMESSENERVFYDTTLLKGLHRAKKVLRVVKNMELQLE